MKIEKSEYSISPSYTAGMSRLTIVFDIKNEKVDETVKLLKGPHEILIQRRKKKRSLTANAYAWVLCEKIAQAVNSTKNEVYKQAICRVGVSDLMSVTSMAAKRLKDSWERNGIGWVCEILRDDGGTADIALYYGSSTYTSSEMARLIDWLVDEAEELKIDVLTPSQRALLIEDWNGNKEGTTN